MIKIKENTDFGTLAICAIRYCFGRMTYMPVDWDVEEILKKRRDES